MGRMGHVQSIDRTTRTRARSVNTDDLPHPPHHPDPHPADHYSW
jgi:hypothetical protein